MVWLTHGRRQGTNLHLLLYSYTAHEDDKYLTLLSKITKVPFLETAARPWSAWRRLEGPSGSSKIGCM